MTLILAKALGLYFVAVGLALVLNPSRIKTLYQQLIKDESFLFLGAIIALLIGAFIISVHNLWVAGWPVIITLIGWWSLIKGFILLVYPEALKPLWSKALNSPEFIRIAGVVWLVIGAFLAYHGWA